MNQLLNESPYCHASDATFSNHFRIKSYFEFCYQGVCIFFPHLLAYLFIFHTKFSAYIFQDTLHSSWTPFALRQLCGILLCLNFYSQCFGTALCSSLKMSRPFPPLECTCHQPHLVRMFTFVQVYLPFCQLSIVRRAPRSLCNAF